MTYLTPQFFDIFGFIAFVYITALAAYAIWYHGRINKTFFLILLLVGIGGMIVDSLIVYSFFIK